MISGHPFIKRALNFRDENGNERCAQCGLTRSAHWQEVRLASEPPPGWIIPDRTR